MDECDKPVCRVAVAGAGFSGAILARQLRMEPGFEVVCFEKMAEKSVRKHWTQPVTGAGASQLPTHPTARAAPPLLRPCSMGPHHTCSSLTRCGGPTGLNINPNALAAMKCGDPALEAQLRGIGLPRESVRASTVSGHPLYEVDMVEDGLASTTGCRVRWDDANTLIRQAAGDCIQFGTAIVDHVVAPDGKITLTLEHSDGSTTQEADFDLLVAAEGRYSPTRARCSGTPATNYGDVCNFRILVPNAQPDGSPWPQEVGETGLFDDLQLVYNDAPSVENLAPGSALRSDPEFTGCVMRSTPRVGIMRIPASKFRDDVGESLYIFGNFAIPDGGDIPESSKTAEAMHCLFTPAGGDAALTPEGSFIRETLSRNAEKLHWARFQDIEPQFSDESGHVCMLGDAAHAFCPSLGQGATTSIEDAFIAASELRKTMRECAGRAEMSAALPATLRRIGQRQTDRVTFIRDISTEAGRHLRFHDGSPDGRSTLEDDARAWTCDDHKSAWRSSVRRMWLDYPQA